MYKYTIDEQPHCLECKDGILSNHLWMDLDLPGQNKYKYGLLKCDKCRAIYWTAINRKTDEIRLLQNVSVFDD